MQYLSNIYPMGSYHQDYSCNNILQGIVINSSSATEMFDNENSNASTISYADAKAIAANKSHSEAERRRRRRINAHLATLRTLVPNTIKTDKASLLAEVVRCLKELKQKTSELATTENVEDGSSYHLDNDVPTSMIPTETDELHLCYIDEEEGAVQATLCCEDRPEMMVEFTRALKSVHAKVVRAEMATIGGRTKSVFWLQLSVFGEEGLATLRRALKVVLDKSILLAGQSHALPGSKRPRLHHFNQSNS
ncbi:hypothetical protein Leryth_005404 [Lithospermum erythrorhizon]|nr:hypothetical protein Leryth_005404 [Lithospermum erythrorhizon]